jgi:hypothetical protein
MGCSARVLTTILQPIYNCRPVGERRGGRRSLSRRLCDAAVPIEGDGDGGKAEALGHDLRVMPAPSAASRGYDEHFTSPWW